MRRVNAMPAVVVVIFPGVSAGETSHGEYWDGPCKEAKDKVVGVWR